MPWTPKHTIIKARAIADNLLAYFEANQVDVLTWAGDGSLKPIKKFSNSVAYRAIPVYPSIAFSDDSDAVDYAGDLATGIYNLTFEVSIQNQDPDTAVIQARKYAAAIISMIRNCPPATLAANAGVKLEATYIDTIVCGFDPIKTNDMQNDFLQVFQIATVFNLMAEGF